MLAKAATGSPKNMQPESLMATSAAPGSNGCTWASPCTKVTLPTPSAAACWRATSSICCGQVDAERRALAGELGRLDRERPVPHPMSSTRSSAAITAGLMRCGRCRHDERS